MSQFFLMGDQTLWNPSNGASRLFRRQVAVFETELGLPSGLGPMREDECRIDPDAFEVFVDALLARHRGTSHAVMIALSEGFVATVLVLAERAGVDVNRERGGPTTHEGRRDVQVPAPPPLTASDEAARAGALRGRARELGRFMAR